MKYFYGSDSYGAREAIGELAKKTGARLRWVDREQLELKSIGDIVGQQAGFFGRDLTVVRDPGALPKSLQEDLATYVSGTGASATWVAWDRVAPDKRSKLWRALAPQAREFPAWQVGQVVLWLERRAGELKGTIEKRAAEALVLRLGSDRWRLENELKRLLIMSRAISSNPSDSPLVRGDGNPSLIREGKGLPAGLAGVGLSLVEQEVAVTEQSQIFTLLDALGRGERAAAVRSVQALLAAGNNEFYILSMLGYQWRTLMVVRSGLDAKASAGSIAKEGKLHPYVVEKNLPLVRSVPLAKWRDGLTRILATDFAIKQGTVDARTGLLMLVITLATR